MSKKRLTDQQQLINFAMGADESALNAAIDSLTAIRDNRYPKQSPKPAKPRKLRADAGTKRGLPSGDKPNGGDNDSADSNA